MLGARSQGRKKSALSHTACLKDRDARPNRRRRQARAISRKSGNPNSLDSDVACKRLILRLFQKSGREFNHFQKKSPANFLTRTAGAETLSGRGGGEGPRAFGGNVER